MAQLWAIRHGQASLFATDYDVLSPRGEEQAQALGRHLGPAGVTFERYVTGPAKRQRDTASLARDAAGQVWPEPVVVPQLDEHDAFGMLARVVPKLGGDPEIARLQKKIADATDKRARAGGFQHLFEAVMKRWLVGDIDPADAEPWPDFRARVLDGLGEIVKLAADPSVRRVAAFSSVGPLAVLLQRALGTDDQRSFETAWRIRNSSITRFEFSRSQPDGPLTLDGFNTLPHLPDPQTWTFR